MKNSDDDITTYKIIHRSGKGDATKALLRIAEYVVNVHPELLDVKHEETAERA